MLYTSSIDKIQFRITAESEINNKSHHLISTETMFKNNEPDEAGLYSAYLGTTDHSYVCLTCRNPKSHCFGHEGRYQLSYPVISPVMGKELLRYLKAICFNCGASVLEDKKYMHLPVSERLSYVKDHAAGQICHSCKTEMKKPVKRDPTESIGFAYIEVNAESGVVIGSRKLYPHIIKDVVNKISDETVMKFGRNVKTHPRSFVLSWISVPPTTIRPDIKKFGGSMTHNDDITKCLRCILRQNKTMATIKVEETDIPLKEQKAISELNNQYHNMILSDKEGTTLSISKRIKGKEGLMRKNMMGKRVRLVARSSIVGDPRLRIDEVGIPMIVAKTLQFEETVQDWNKDIFTFYVRNGWTKYPGASRVIKKSTGIEHNVDLVPDIILEAGDIVFRDLITGDTVNYNRLPSLFSSSITTFRAVVSEDPNVQHVFRMNVIVCPIFNADFDGDAMHVIVHANVHTRSETKMLSPASKALISREVSAPAIGQSQDSIIGIFELTKNSCRLDRHHALLLFQNTSFFPDLSDVFIPKNMDKNGAVAGRLVVSKVLQRSPVTLEKFPTYYLKSLENWINYDPNDIKKTVIVHGNLVQGILDKSIVGKGGIIYSLVAAEYGNEVAMSLIFDLQQIAIAYINIFGYTMTIADIVLPLHAKAIIDNISSSIIRKSELITDQLNRGEIIAPIGSTIEQYYERLQINCLKSGDDFAEVVTRNIDVNSNNLVKMVLSGSKGDLNQMNNMMSSIGQKLINDRRAEKSFGYERSLVYFRRFETSPESRGYILNSYVTGLTSPEFIFNAMNTRYDLISRALLTAVTGYQCRKSIKNLETNCVNNLFMVTKGTSAVIQFVVGDNGLDTRRIVKDRYEGLFVSNKEFEDRFHYMPKNTALTDLFETEWQLLLADRLKFRDVQRSLERIKNDSCTDVLNVAVAVTRLVDDMVASAGEGLLSKEMLPEEELADIASTIAIACEDMPCVFTNERYREAGIRFDRHIKSVWVMSALIRLTLCTKNVVKFGLTSKAIDLILHKIRSKYCAALMSPGASNGISAAQAYSEQMTQYLLNATHRSASGGTSMSATAKTNQVFGAYDSTKIQGLYTTVEVQEHLAGDELVVKSIAKEIEENEFKKFILTRYYIFFETFDRPVHSQHKQDAVIIKAFVVANPLLQPPNDLTKWCIKWPINRVALIINNTTIEFVVSKLQAQFRNMYFVHTPENTRGELFIRGYVTDRILDAMKITPAMAENGIEVINNAIMSCIVQGIQGMKNAQVIKLIRSEIMDDGSMSVAKNRFAITVEGINFEALLRNKNIDPLRFFSDDIHGIANILGIEAAHRIVVKELQSIVPGLSYCHYLIFADEMMSTGRMTSIALGGLATREHNNILLRLAMSSPVQTLEEAAIHTTTDTVRGVSARLLLGSTPRRGSTYNQTIVDEAFVKANMSTIDSLLEEL